MQEYPKMEFQSDSWIRTHTARDVVQNPQRILAFDLAKGLAVLVMLVVNATHVFPAIMTAFPWIRFCEGRAFPIFLILFGVGVARSSASWARLLRRAGTLLTLGLLLASVWPYEILHVYAGLLLLGRGLRRYSTPTLWGGFAISLISFSALVLLVPFSHQYGPLIRYVYNGYFAILPQSAFLLAGLLFERYRPHRIWWMSVGALLVLATTLVSSVSMSYLCAHPGARQLIVWCRMVPYPALPLSVCQAIGVSLLVLGGCTLCARWRLWTPIRWLGRTSLYWYPGHILVLCAWQFIGNA
jgi:uncharacterized membrane protein YeiB